MFLTDFHSSSSPGVGRTMLFPGKNRAKLPVVFLICSSILSCYVQDVAGWTQLRRIPRWHCPSRIVIGVPPASSCSSFISKIRFKGWPLYFSENEEDKEKEDWRDVRAKLIQQYRSEQRASWGDDGESVNSTTATVTLTKWAYDSGDVIERGSLIVSHPVQDFACGGLRQQYFHKCVVLVVKHHDGQHDFTKGLILNRPTQRSKLKDKHNNEWTVWFSGDVQGLHSPNPDYTCLHRLKSPKALEMSLPVVKDIYHTTWELAQHLVQQGEARPEDFWLGCGYAGWRPNQLQLELERLNWFMVACDSESIFELLDQQQDMEEIDATGMGMWLDFMWRIGKESLVAEYATKQKFEDSMLQEWIIDKLLPSKLERMEKERNSGMIIEPPDRHPGAFIVQEGTIFRSSHPILLDEQVFHESLVLVLKSDERGIIGAILNRPSSKVAVLNNTNLPLRYGGRYGLEQQGRPETWFHCGNEALRNAKVGVPVVPEDESLIWQCSREDAETAVEIGLASPNDFMVVLGFTLWERYPPPEGIGVPLTRTNLEKEFSPVPKATIPQIWKELLTQEVLTKETLSKNIIISKTAHHLASPQEDVSLILGKDDFSLADDALERWIKRFLMKGAVGGGGDDSDPPGL